MEGLMIPLGKGRQARDGDAHKKQREAVKSMQVMWVEVWAECELAVSWS